VRDHCDDAPAVRSHPCGRSPVDSHDTEEATLSTESIASSSQTHADTVRACVGCGAPIASDQRYCLECGERCVPMSSVLSGASQPTGAQAQVPSQPPGAVQPPPPTPPTGPAFSGAGGQRNNALTLLAGVGVLLLAMGVGVLIGRSGSPKSSSAPPEVVSVASTPTGSGATTAAPEATFSSDWPAGTHGFTVQLQTLPQSGTTAAEVAAAKASDGAKGAPSVGALKSEEFSSLTGSAYVIYSGVYHQRGEASKALSSLRKSFPAAKVIEVSNKGSGGAGSSSSSSTSHVSITHPAPPTVLNKLKNAKKGKSYEEESKNLPDVVETG
jgi:hypothetical protein